MGQALYESTVDFQTVLFTDECRATLDGPDGWSRGWLVNVMARPSRHVYLIGQVVCNHNSSLWPWHSSFKGDTFKLVTTISKLFLIIYFLLHNLFLTWHNLKNSAYHWHNAGLVHLRYIPTLTAVLYHYRDYFMVGECVRFLFTSCEGSLNERVSAANEWV